MVKRNHHYPYRRIAYQLKYSGQTPVAGWRQPNIVTADLKAEYCKNRLMTSHRAIGKKKGLINSIART